MRCCILAFCGNHASKLEAASGLTCSSAKTRHQPSSQRIHFGLSGKLGALWHAREQELLDGALAQVAPRDGVEALPHHEVLGVHFMRKVVVEALGAVPYRARQVEAMDGAFEDGGRRRVAVAKRRERRREAALSKVRAAMLFRQPTILSMLFRQPMER
jgi:hypothetical protein